MEQGLKLKCFQLYVCFFLFRFAVFAVFPVLTDVIMEALCPEEDECSLAIYITGFNQAVTGLGSVLAAPLMGNLSVVYGRKSLLRIPFTLCIIPYMILAYSRTTNFVYANYITKTLSGVVENSVDCLDLAYVADNISKGKHGSMFGMLTGVGSAGMLAGTLAARFIPVTNIFLIAAITSVITAVYLQLFLKDSSSPPVALRQSIMKTTTDGDEVNCESSKVMKVFNTTSSFRNSIRFLNNSKTFMLAAFVAFFNMLAFGGLEASLFLFVMPFLAPHAGDNILLSVGIFSALTMALLDSIAWSFWVPFSVAGLCFIFYMAMPFLYSIISKQAGKDDQGMAQGCISSIGSLANILPYLTTVTRRLTSI